MEYLRWLKDRRNQLVAWCDVLLEKTWPYLLVVVGLGCLVGAGIWLAQPISCGEHRMKRGDTCTTIDSDDGTRTKDSYNGLVVQKIIGTSLLAAGGVVFGSFGVVMLRRGPEDLEDSVPETLGD